ncbi:triose-phosphate isomerase [Microbulbifer yueqingensis]|uniref:Triosephosphate isomerase n=1 Tax=Microbulbifer yueqingensis TaxID=658219 RepID=A0A1G8XN69_9GAMM|nr:triose-phosphate isomerase [Microbulbifer yueqingensis]SDJ91220.1 triosephosphate isomerase [Microbulbifer yueqingensis]
MPKPLVAANWKMNGSRAFVEEFFGAFDLAGVEVDVAICPPFPYLSLVADCVASVASERLSVGAQNASQEESGAYTGEVSTGMLADFGVQYVIVGHSERRSRYGESSELVAEKFSAVKRAGLVPILCVGETLEEREGGHTLEVVRAQLEAVTDFAGNDAWHGAVVAYEPVWAIGTGKTATPEQAQEVHRFIREKLGEAGAETPLLYGGSVKGANAGALFAQADIDGALVGGASLDAKEFAGICRAAEK